MNIIVEVAQRFALLAAGENKLTKRKKLLAWNRFFAQHTSRPIHAVLGAVEICNIIDVLKPILI